MRKWIATISLLAAIATAESNKTIPNFSLPDLDGVTHNQDEFKGKVVLIDFWATWCSSCKEIAPIVKAWNDKYSAKGLVVLGISTDKDKRVTAEKIKKSAEKEGLNYKVLWDQKNVLADSLKFKAVPSLFLFDANGNLVKSFDGFDKNAEKEIGDLLAKLLP